MPENFEDKESRMWWLFKIGQSAQNLLNAIAHFRRADLIKSHLSEIDEMTVAEFMANHSEHDVRARQEFSEFVLKRDGSSRIEQTFRLKCMTDGIVSSTFSGDYLPPNIPRLGKSENL